jgi:hypothetical protein
MKHTSTYTLATLLVVMAVGGIGYNAWIDRRDQQAYAEGMALLAAQEAEPTTRRTLIEDGVTWHEKCEKGFCWRATNPESLEHPLVRKGGGIPVYDMAAIREMEKRAEQAD